jgi:hypothetical protein
MLVNKINCCKYKEGGKEFKVFYYANVVAARNSNLPHYGGNLSYYEGNIPYIIATCLYS